MFKLTRNKVLSLAALAVLIAIIFLAIIIFLPGLGRVKEKPLTLTGPENINARLVLASKGPFYIGDLIPMVLEVDARPGVEYQMPELTSINLGKLQLKSKTVAKPVEFQAGIRNRINYTLTGWASGEFTVSGPVLEYRDSAGKVGKYQVGELQVTISSLLPRNKSEAELLALNIKNLKAPFGLPPNYQYLWWFLALASVLALVYLLARYWRSLKHRQKQISATEGAELEPAHVIARRKLAELSQKDYLGQGDFKIYYSELSEIIREYMENRFQIRALEMTTEEFLTLVAASDQLTKEHRQELKGFMQSSDLVKFAKHLPLIEEAENALAIISRLIEETKAEPTENPSQTEGSVETGTNTTGVIES